jgi:RNA polymerase sigma-70 factor (ECF subfamily)
LGGVAGAAVPEELPGSRTAGPGRADELAALARSGDREAFTELVLLTSPQVFALARRLVGNEHDASDVLQETYLRAFRAIARYRGESAVTTWLYRITANCAATHLHRRRWSRIADVDEALVVADPRVVEAGDRSGDRELLRAALADLPDLLRAVVVLRDVYDLPHEAIAKELGISRGAAKVRLHRARVRLRELLPSPAGEPRRPAVAATRAVALQAASALARSDEPGDAGDDEEVATRAVGL